MPQRNGQPTAQEVAALAAGQGTAQLPPPGQGVSPAMAAAIALAATTAATAAATTAPPALASGAASRAVQTAAAGIIGAFDRFLASRRVDQEQHISDLLAEASPGMPEDARLEVVDGELEREKAFAAKARARLDEELPAALAIPDRKAREEAVQAILDQEKRYLALREQAVADRALGTAEQRGLEETSPLGAYWQLSPAVAHHTPDCVAMAGRVWPHSVLKDLHPPVHFGCQCRLRSMEYAQAHGLLHPGVYASHDESIHARQMLEAPELDDLLEATAERWWKGTAGPGRFRARHGDLAAGLRRPREPKMPESVRTLGDELDTRPLKVDGLAAGDRLMVDGVLVEIGAVLAPGVFELAGGETVRVTRDTVLGVVGRETAGDEASEPMPAPAEIPGRPDPSPLGGSDAPSNDPAEKLDAPSAESSAVDAPADQDPAQLGEKLGCAGDLPRDIAEAYDLLEFNPDELRLPDGRWTDSVGNVMQVASAADRARLSIPPAWTHVMVASAEHAGQALQAIGTDSKGRTQRVYSSEHQGRQAGIKFARIRALHGKIDGIDRQLAADKSDAGAALTLIRRTGLRPGSDANTGAEVAAYGATNLRVEHVTVTGDTVRLKFTGKKGVALDFTLHDATLAKLLGPRVVGKAASDRVFATDAGKVRARLSEIAPGFKVKDLRTYRGTRLAHDLVAAMPPPASAKELRAARNQVGDAVAAALGNTRAVALASYIDPSAFAPWHHAP